jgi:hypothetical protein
MKNNSNRRNYKQHYVSQGYLRNFSPDIVDYQKNKFDFDRKTRQKIRENMRIHYYEKQSGTIYFDNIKKLAWVRKYFSNEIDIEIQKIENQLPLLRNIIQNGTESFLYEGNNQQIVFEIANFFATRAISFRHLISNLYDQFIDSLPRISPITKKLMKETKNPPKTLQSLTLTEDPEKFLLESFLEAYIKIFPEKDKFAVERMIKKHEHHSSAAMRRYMTTINDLKEFKMLYSNFFPILIENKSSIPFITGDNCVVAMRFFSESSLSGISYYFFPIGPRYAINFLSKKEFQSKFTRTLSDGYKVLQLNHHLYNTSNHFAFANEEKVLRLVTNFE